MTGNRVIGMNPGRTVYLRTCIRIRPAAIYLRTWLSACVRNRRFPLRSPAAIASVEKRRWPSPINLVPTTSWIVARTCFRARAGPQTTRSVITTTIMRARARCISAPGNNNCRRPRRYRHVCERGCGCRDRRRDQYTWGTVVKRTLI